MMDKTDFRRKAKEIRKNLGIKKISEAISANIAGLKEFQNAKHIMLYYPIKNELNLLNLMTTDQYFYLPRMKNKELEVCPYNQGDNLKITNYNIPEPITTPVDKNIVDLVLVPALMADSLFNRLGYGGGYYDRFFANTNYYKIVGIPDELLADQLPTEETDIKCDCIVTQSKILKQHN